MGGPHGDRRPIQTIRRIDRMAGHFGGRRSFAERAKVVSMVRLGTIPLAGLCATLLASLLPNALANDPPAYSVGDVAQENIATPSALTVVDLEATESLRRQEASSVAQSPAS